MSMQHLPTIRRGSRWWGLLAGFWTLVGLLYAGMAALGHQVAGGAPEGFSFVWTLLRWHTWIPATLLVLWMARGFPLRRRSWWWVVPLHGAAAIGTSLFASLLFAAMRGAAEGFAYSALARDVFAQNLALDAVIYLALLAGVHALEHYRRHRERALQAAQLEAELAEAQLYALKVQLHPHFLFNTFHTIAMLLRQHREEEAIDAIAALSDLFRYVLEHADMQEVPLQQELGFLESYIAIEKLRFGEALEVQIDVAPAVLQARLPHVLLQPLVENAIRHGIEPAGQPGRIKVSAWREDDRLCLQVRDNGNGLPPDGLREGHEGIGLGNTRKRLARLYGPAHRLDLANASAGGGLLVTLALPYRPAPPGPAKEERGPTPPSDLRPPLAHRRPLAETK